MDTSRNTRRRTFDGDQIKRIGIEAAKLAVCIAIAVIAVQHAFGGRWSTGPTSDASSVHRFDFKGTIY